jgi:hypothetical protein
LIGGYDKLGAAGTYEAQYKNLPPHYKAIITLNFVKIDSWND